MANKKKQKPVAAVFSLNGQEVRLYLGDSVTYKWTADFDYTSVSGTTTRGVLIREHTLKAKFVRFEY